MEVTGERHLPIPRQQVWLALHDADTLRRCIPGCLSLTEEGDQRFQGSATLDIHGAGTTFDGMLTLSDTDPPASCRLIAEATGAANDMATFAASVMLEQEAGATMLRYAVAAEVEGREPRRNAVRLATGTRVFVERFLDNLVAIVAAPAPVAADGLPAAIASIPSASRISAALPSRIFGFPPLAWGAAGVFVFIVFNLFVAS